jgi:UDPglucose--hexose-1-phosphate uridylyltransferase
MSSRFIFDELTNTPTILASDRFKRGDATGVVGKSSVTVPTFTGTGKNTDAEKGEKSETPSCPFCKGSESITTETTYQDSDDWNVRVFSNKYPIIGDHEIIVHSPYHFKDIEDLPHDQNVKILRAMLARMPFYTAQNKEVIIFNNRGGKAGASQTHPHSQLIALNGFPGIIEKEKINAVHYYNEHSSCYWCDYVKKDLADGNRVVTETKHFVLLVPAASRWSYEMIMIPKEHRPNFEYIPEVEINDLARLLKATLTGYNVLFDRPDRNFWIHTQRYDPFHWHIGLIPQLKVLGGLELGAGIWVSDRSSPEDAAKKLSGPVTECYESETSSIGIL